MIVSGEYIHTAVFKMDKEQGPTVQHMELSLILCGSLDRRGALRENGYMCVCVAESPQCNCFRLIFFICHLAGYEF